MNNVSDDPRLVQCFRKADCSLASRIGNQSMSISYCCANQVGLATSSASGVCSLCNVTDAEIANVTSLIHRPLTYATCVLWGLNHFRTYDGLYYDFQGS